MVGVAFAPSAGSVTMPKTGPVRKVSRRPPLHQKTVHDFVDRVERHLRVVWRGEHLRVGRDRVRVGPDGEGIRALDVEGGDVALGLLGVFEPAHGPGGEEQRLQLARVRLAAQHRRPEHVRIRFELRGQRGAESEADEREARRARELAQRLDRLRHRIPPRGDAAGIFVHAGGVAGAVVVEAQCRDAGAREPVGEMAHGAVGVDVLVSEGLADDGGDVALLFGGRVIPAEQARPEEQRRARDGHGIGRGSARLSAARWLRRGRGSEEPCRNEIVFLRPGTR